MAIGKIYAIQMGNTMYFKIGITLDNVHKRASELQTGNPIRLIPRLELEISDARLGESIVHDKYWLSREMGEWFYFDPDEIRYEDVLSYIKNDLQTHINERLGLINEFLQCPYCGNTVTNKTVLENVVKKGYCSRCSPRNNAFQDEKRIKEKLQTGEV